MNDCFRFNEPIRTPNHPDKAYAVVAKDGEDINIIRFGEQFEEREWVGLTWDDIEEVFDTPDLDVSLQKVQWISAMVEAKLKEKNT